MVVALARPDVHDLFPRLWAARSLQEVRLGELGRKPCERLVREVLGEGAPADTVERVIAQAGGNAFYLEELIRAVAEGKGDRLPETVLAMVQARLGALEPEARRIMRAGSVFGEVFWRGGVEALLGTSDPGLNVPVWLDELVERELVLRKTSSKFPGDEEYTFRHALMREGAYAMLTEGDRALGHRLAAEFLEKAGERGVMVLAEHFDRGDDAARAGAYYLRAAEQALRGGDTDAAMDRARRGLARPVPEPVKVGLLGILGEAHGWRGEWDASAAYAEEVMRLAPPGSAPWVVSATVKLVHAADHGRMDAFMATLTVLETVEPAPDAVGAVAFALATGVFILDTGGRFDLAEAGVRRAHAVVEPVKNRDLIARAWMAMTHTHREACVHEDPRAGLAWSEAARESFEEASHRRGILFAQVMVGMNAWFLGDLEGAERALRSTMVVDEELGLLSTNRTLFFAGVLGDRGALGEARAEASRLAEIGRERRSPIHEGRGRWALADVLRREGDLERAEREALAALDLLAPLPLDRAAATATLAAVRLAAGNARAALVTAREAMGRYEALGSFGFRGSFARLVYAEALHAAGEREAARAAIARARDALRAQAEKVGGEAMRRRFLEGVPEHARTMALAIEWGA